MMFYVGSWGEIVESWCWHRVTNWAYRKSALRWFFTLDPDALLSTVAAFCLKNTKTRALKQNYYLAKVHLGSHFWRRQRRPERRFLVGWESFEAVRLCQSCQMLRMYSYVWGENLVEHRVLPNQATEGNICTTVGFSAQTSFISYVELSTFFSRSNLLVSSIFNSVNGFSHFSRLSWG